MMRSANPKAWNVSTLRAWMPSAWPISSRPGRRSMMRVLIAGNCDSCAAATHAGRAGADDQHVDCVGEFLRPVEAGAGGGLDARIAGYVAVMVELHPRLLTVL